MSDDEASAVGIVQDVCGINADRAHELLEAGGTVQRAIDIHLGGTTGQVGNALRPRATESPLKEATMKRQQERKPRSSNPTPSPRKQAKLSSFFTAKKPNPSEKRKTESKNDANNIPMELNNKQEHAEAVNMDDDHKLVSSPRKEKKSPGKAPVTDPRLHYLVLAEAFSSMTATTKRLEKIEVLRNVLRNVIGAVGGIGNLRENESTRLADGETLSRTLQLILPGGALKLQVSGSLVSQAVRTVTGASSTRLREAYRETGDLGDAAEKFVRNQTLLIKPEPLTIDGVYELLLKIASQEGKNSQSQRHELMIKLLRSCRRNEMRFLVRTLLGNMRIGANLRTVIVSLAGAVVEEEKIGEQQEGLKALQEKAAKAIQETFDICPRFDRIALALLVGGMPYMQKTCVLEVGTPVNPMLANPAHSFAEVSKIMTAPGNGSHLKQRVREAFAEYKYDGVRCQAHFDGQTVRLFSRNLLENTEQFPDVVRALLDARVDDVESFIVDSEVVAVEDSGEENGEVRLLPFQDLSTRSGAVLGSASNPVRVRVYAFDLIFLNGRCLTNQPLWKRREALHQHFKETSGFGFASSLTLESFNEATLSGFLEQAVRQGTEGLMVKLSGRINPGRKSAQDGKNEEPLTCQYESGTRSQTWLKVKRDYVAGFADTIDVVPIGAWYGNGRKAKKGFLSPVLLAVYDEEEEMFRSISRCMSFTDAMYESMREFYFHGIPYPDGVGLSSSMATGDTTSALPAVEEKVGDSDKDEGRQDASGSEEDLAGSKSQVVGVNCYPERPPAVIDTNERPPIWFKPMEVFEVSFADLSLSRAHTAAVGMIDADSSRGVALRFPRFIRRRPDKNVEQATSSVQIAQLFAKQSKQGRKM